MPGIIPGGLGTQIEHPADMTHLTYTEEELKRAGISYGLVRLSAGFEDPEDLIGDLGQAFASIVRVSANAAIAA